MKTPAFWYEPKGKWAHGLAPLGMLYRQAGRLRRLITSPYRSPVPLICVGNIVAGGAGKTPTVLALTALLREKGHKPAIVLRGYGGSEPGPRRVDPALDTAALVGDEALLLAQAAPCWIAKNRVDAVKNAAAHADIVVMDDGFQNPSVRPDIAFLVVDGNSGFGNGSLIPAGPLREELRDAMPRLTATILIGEDKTGLLSALQEKPVLHAHIEPRLPPDFQRTQPFVAFSGIARPQKFFDTCATLGLNLAGTRAFADHHPFSTDELEEMWEAAQRQGAGLLTTTKDWVRLPEAFRAYVQTLPVTLVFDAPDEVAAFL